MHPNIHTHTKAHILARKWYLRILKWYTQIYLMGMEGGSSIYLIEKAIGMVHEGRGWGSTK